jgi:hypothetical protein
MDRIIKPKLVFFQWKHQGLSKFVLSHRQQHIKCLTEFFDVVVINEDCDYQQICDKYQPDLTLFESGVNYQSCQRLKIKNTHTYSEIPKLGFHNGDSWCNARAGFISDMENWNIETFFSICTTTAEHTPEIAENLFVWPNFIDSEIYKDYEQPKIIPVMFTGYIHSLYPWRQKIYKIVSQYYPSLTCPHLGYNENSVSRMLVGEQYARTINASWFVPTCGSIEKEIVRKHFEIPASKSCLITEKTPALESAGFIDMHNCVFADEIDVLDKLDYLFQNPNKLEEIIEAGYQLVQSQHTLKQRDQIFQWFNLYKNLKPNQKIVQTNPFKPLSIVEKSSEIKNSHIIGNGLIIKLLRQGDEKLWSGKYEEAETLYLQCLNYIYWMPEPKLRLALCNLYKGNAEAAMSWVLQPIKYTLEEYKALDPDPVEWTYFIISLLCQEKLDEAIIRANQFPSLCHPELDRTRWIINFLQKKEENTFQPYVQSSNPRYSVHQLPNRSIADWINNLCTMLKRCQQFHLAEILNKLVSSEYQSLKITHRNPSKYIEFSEYLSKKLVKYLNINLSKKRTYESSIELKPISKQNNIKIRLSRWIKPKLKKFVLKPLNRLESKFGYFLPYRFSEIKNDEFFIAIQKLTREENIKTVLLIGAGIGEVSTEAFLTNILKNPNKPIVFCMNLPSPLFVKLQKRHVNNSVVKCYQLSSTSLENFSNQLENVIAKIKQENDIDIFDVVIIDSSKLTINFKLNKLNEARFVLLDNINNFQNHKNYYRLITESNYTLVAQNPSLRNGYAIFKKVNNDMLCSSATNLTKNII